MRSLHSKAATTLLQKSALQSQQPFRQIQSATLLMKRSTKEPTKEPIELKFRGGYISVEGSLIQSIGRQSTEQQVPRQFRRKKAERDEAHISKQGKAARQKDGEHYHMTLISPPDLKYLLNEYPFPPEIEKKHKRLHLMNHIMEQMGHPQSWELPLDLGLGHVRDQDSEAYFHVIFWPFGQRIRESLGLSPTPFFHITVGFMPKDVHTVDKGLGTLLILKGQGEDWELQRLVEVAHHFVHDRQFLDALLRQCEQRPHLGLIYWINELYRRGKCTFSAGFLVEYTQTSCSPQHEYRATTLKHANNLYTIFISQIICSLPPLIFHIPFLPPSSIQLLQIPLTVRNSFKLVCIA